MSYVALALASDQSGWSARPFSLHDLADLEDVTDRLRDASRGADVSLLLIEGDDQYLVILRLDEGEDLRIFGSDIAFAEESRLGALLLAELAQPQAIGLAVSVPVGADGEEDSDDVGQEDLSVSRGAREPTTVQPPPLEAEPVGDVDILTDFGVSATALLELCAHPGLLPSDVTARLSRSMGCGDLVEELREA